MEKQKTDLIRDNLVESRQLRKEMSEAGDEFVSSLRRIANREGGWSSKSARNGSYANKNGRVSSAK